MYYQSKYSLLNVREISVNEFIADPIPPRNMEDHPEHNSVADILSRRTSYTDVSVHASEQDRLIDSVDNVKMIF